MGRAKRVRTYEYVNHPYDQVRDYLMDPENNVFQVATRSVSSRATDLSAKLHFEFAGVELGRGIDIDVLAVNRNDSDESLMHHKTTFVLRWQAASTPQLFPLMKGKLSLYPLTRTETQIEFSGAYDPPLGIVGKAFDAIAGHRVAQASVHQFIDEIATHIRRHLSEETAPAAADS